MFPGAATTPTPVSLPRAPQLSSSVEGRTVVDGQTDPVSVEAYRRLAAALHLMQEQSKLRRVMVSSALPNDGKTLTATNLALTLSDAYNRRVLLIDADLRKPSVHEVFQLDNSSGLTTALRASPNTPLPLTAVTPRLSVLTAGRSQQSPMADLTSERMREIMDDVSERFDWIIVDTPPVGLLSDASLLAALADGVVLVIGARTTQYAAVQKAVSEFGQDRILGVVLNRVTDATPEGDKYHRSYYQGRSRDSGS